MIDKIGLLWRNSKSILSGVIDSIGVRDVPLHRPYARAAQRITRPLRRTWVSLR
jgi:hypothetical protein